MKLIQVTLYVEDVSNPCDAEALSYVKQIIDKAFKKESTQSFPRCRLVLGEFKFKNSSFTQNGLA